MKKSILFILLLFALSCGQSQTEIKSEIFIKDSDGKTKPLSALTIKIIKKEKFESLKNSEITIADVDYFATTGADGKFSVKTPNGEYVAIANYSEEKHFLGKSYEIPFSWRVPFTAHGGEQKIYMY